MVVEVSSVKEAASGCFFTRSLSHSWARHGFAFIATVHSLEQA